MGAETGVFPAVNALNVTAVNATSVSVAPGACALQTSIGGTYIATVPTATTVGVTAQASNARIDLVCVRVLDSEAGDGLGQTIRARLLTVEGAPSASPSAPATPAGYLVLAQLLVNSSGITVTDRRQFTSAAGGVRLGGAADTRNGAYPGHLRAYPDGRIDIWTGSQWLTIVSPAAWTTQSATWQYAGAGSVPAGNVAIGTGGVSTLAWKLAGKDLWCDWNLSLGSSGVGGGAGDVSTLLPAGLVSVRDQWMPAVLFAASETGFNSLSSIVLGAATVRAGQSAVTPLFPASIYPSLGIDMRMFGLRNTDATLNRQTGVPKIPNSFPLVPTSGLHVGPGLIQVQ